MRGQATPEKATRSITRELFADHPSYRGHMVFEGMSMGTLDLFRRDAEAWLKDRSELDGDVYEIADWPAIYEEFKGWK